MTTNQRKIKNFVIRPHQQLTLAGLISAVVTVLLLALVIFDHYASVEKVRALAAIHQMDEQLVFETTQSMASSAAYISFFIAGLGIVFFLFLLWITHSYFGPIVAINKMIIELRSGNYGVQRHLRQGDQMQDVMTNLNSLSQDLKEKKNSAERSNS